MRLIDADDLKARAREEAVTMEEPWKSKFAILVEWLVDKTFTAYDVEAVVAELKKIKKVSACDEIRCDECKYTKICFEGEKSYKVALDRAISIVRGKE